MQKKYNSLPIFKRLSKTGKSAVKKPISELKIASREKTPEATTKSKPEATTKSKPEATTKSKPEATTKSKSLEKARETLKDTPEATSEVAPIENIPEATSEVAPIENIPEIKPFAGKETRSTSPLLLSINNFVKGYKHVYTTLNNTNKKKLPLYALRFYKNLQAIGEASDDTRFFIKPFRIRDIPNAEQVKDFDAINEVDDGLKDYYSDNTSIYSSLSKLKIENEAVKFTRRYVNLLNAIYLNKYEELSKDPVWKSILDESPLYMDEIIEFENSGRTDKELFVIDLINQANTYGRRMRSYNNYVPTAEDALHMRGQSAVVRGSTIDVIGKPNSLLGDYGNHSYLFLGHPTLSGPMETWWSLRIPLGVHVVPGFTYSRLVHKLCKKIDDRFGRDISSMPSIRLLNTKIANQKWINYPVHLAFYGNYDEVLPNFTVLVDKDVPYDIKYSKGYKQGGKLIPRKF